MTRSSEWTPHKLITEVRILERNIGRRPTKWDKSYFYTLSRKFFGSWNNMMEVAGYKVKRNQTIKIPKLSSNLFYLLGLLVTDGHIQYIKGKKYSVLFFTSHKEEKDMIVSLIEKLFNYKPFVRNKLYGWNKLTSFELHISSKRLVEFLHKKFNIPYGNKSNKIRVPKIIFKRKDRDIKNFLRGVVDGDGGIGEKSIFVSISSGSRNFLKDIKILFDKIGIDFGRIRKSGENVWDIRIFKREAIYKLSELLYNSQYYYPRKRKILNKILNTNKQRIISPA